jgi:ketosteroid isomerase-like protein
MADLVLVRCNHARGLKMNTQVSRATLVLVLVSFAALSPLAAEPVDSSAEAALRVTMAEHHKASLEGDTQTIAASMTDDYLQTDISGVVQNKETWLKNYFIPLADLIKAGKFRWETYDEKDVKVRIHGDTGIVIGTLEAKGSGARFDVERHTWVADPNAEFGGKLHFTRVYVRRDDKWLLAALQNAVPVSPTATKK